MENNIIILVDEFMMKVPVVRSPLSIVALFVILIEAFLAYPLTQLQEPELLVIVIFMVLFPSFVASLFFIFLWKKPVHFYNPKEIPSDLRRIYQSETPRTSALELRLEELQNEHYGLLKRNTKPDTAVIDPEDAPNLGKKALESELNTLESEISGHIGGAETTDEATLERVKQEVKQKLAKAKQETTQQIRQQMAKFRNWLEDIGFNDPPDIPKNIWCADHKAQSIPTR